MKVITMKKKTLLRVMMILIFAFSVCRLSVSFGMKHYYKVDFSTGLVTATTLNVRSGPGTQYKVIATVKKNEYIRVFAGIGEWYIVQVEGDYVGAVSSKYVKAIYPIHMNPIVRQAADEELGSCDRIHIIEPLEVIDFHNFLSKSYLIFNTHRT